MGITDNSETEVIEGLKAGERVATATLSGAKEEEKEEGPPPSL